MAPRPKLRSSSASNGGSSSPDAVHVDLARRVYDAERTWHLAALGILVVRFEKRTVSEEPKAALAAIATHFRAAQRTSAPP